jgi:putative endonuclease
MKMDEKKAHGNAGEDLAVAYLEMKGYHILNRNYFYGKGEIDIIARDGETLVFVEVKSRHSPEFCEPEDAVSQAKAKVVRRTAEGYLLNEHIDDPNCRCDILAVDYCQSPPSITHILDAF